MSPWYNVGLLYYALIVWFRSIFPIEVLRILWVACAQGVAREQEIWVPLYRYTGGLWKDSGRDPLR